MRKKRWIPPRWAKPKEYKKTDEDYEYEEIIRLLRIRGNKKKMKKEKHYEENYKNK
jgi:hypothetical protein